MSDRSAEAVPAATPDRQATAAAAAGRPDCAWWVGMVVLLDYIAAFLAFAAAGGYLILKVYNDQQSSLMRLIEVTGGWCFYLGLYEVSRLPHTYAGNFADPFFADVYMLSMAAIHLLAAAGFLALAVALGGFRSWARRAQIFIALIAILILGASAIAYSASPAPGGALAVMAVAAIVHASVLAILLAPGIAPLFAEARRLDAEPPSRARLRGRYQSRLLLATFLGLVVLGALVTVLVLSVPVAIHLKLMLTTAP